LIILHLSPIVNHFFEICILAQKHHPVFVQYDSKNYPDSPGTLLAEANGGLSCSLGGVNLLK